MTIVLGSDIIRDNDTYLTHLTQKLTAHPKLCKKNLPFINEKKNNK